MNQKEKFSYLTRRISKNSNVKAIFFFGSRTTPRHRKDSDYDIAVLTNTNREEELNIIGLGDDTFNISIFHCLPLIIKFRIIKQGKLIFCRDKQFVQETTLNVLRNYLDFAPMMKKFYARYLYARH